MKTLLRVIAGVLALFVTAFVVVFYLWPRPPDTTDPRIFAGDAVEVDHCDLPVLDGDGLRADDIPKAFTPGCGYERFPMPTVASRSRRVWWTCEACGSPTADLDRATSNASSSAVTGPS
jgi:hypothetical protein